MTKKLFLLFALFVGINSINAQTKEELQAQKAEKQAAADALQGEANAIQAQIDAFQVGEKVLLEQLEEVFLNLVTGMLKDPQIILLEILDLQ